MPNKTNAIALYGLENLDLMLMFNVAQEFFRRLGVVPTDCGYTTKLIKKKNGESIGSTFASIIDVRRAIDSNRATDFSISYRAKNDPHWSCDFSCDTGAWSEQPETGKSFRRITACYDNKIANLSDPQFHENLIDLASSAAKIDYGIIYQTHSPADANMYANGSGLISVFDYENPSTWKHQLPPYLHNGVPDYTHKLRMIYPYNIITSSHLSQKIEGISLGDWIKATRSRGKIARTKDIFIWHVAPEMLDEVNEACGKAGILLCWREKKPNIKKKRIP